MTSGKQLWKHLWNDETGTVLSAELVLVGTLGVIGATAGIAAVGHSVDGELEEVAYSLRSLDQSYHLEGHRGCRAWTAGSSYTQRPVEESHDELRRVIERHRKEAAGHQEGDGRDERIEPRRDRDREEDRDERTDRRRERDAEEDAERWDGDDRRRDADADRRDDERRRERDDEDDRSAREDDDRRRDSERNDDDRRERERDEDDRRDGDDHPRSRDRDDDDR